MARSLATRSRNSRLAVLPSTLRLARWQLRQSWRLLLVAGLGIILAVMVACAVPLFSRITTSAGLRSALAAPIESNGITISVPSTGMSAGKIGPIGMLIEPLVQAHLGPYLIPGNQFSTQLTTLPITSTSNGALSGILSDSTMQVVGYDEQQLAPHVTLLAGRLPHANTQDAGNVEIALTQETANSLGLSVGSTILLDKSVTYRTAAATPIVVHIETAQLTVVGIVTLQDGDVFFHRVYFEPQPIAATGFYYHVIAANDALVSFLQAPQDVDPGSSIETAQLNWYYALNPAHLDAGALDTLAARASALQAILPNALIELSTYSTISGNAFATLSDYQARISALQVPITFLLLEILAFVLFFVSVIAEVIVDRQAGAIAVLRSRGVSRLQIFGALMAQSLVLGVFAFVIGPLLTIVAVVGLVHFALSPEYQGALDLLAANPLRAAYDPPWYALAAVGAALGAMAIAINRATSADVLAVRLEAARTTRKPVWQRLNLDVMAAIIAVTGSLLYSLVLSRVSPDVQDQFDFLGLIAPCFLLLAGTLLFFRFYPRLLRFAAWLVERGRGAVPTLSLAQMSRSPRQSMRTTLLLAIATALMIFTIIFTTSETQHLRDVAAYNVGADFSGFLPDTNNTDLTLDQRMAPYEQIPGVTSVALGYLTVLPPNSGYNPQLIAVDADHYGQTATWDARNSDESLTSLMARLVNDRAQAISQGIIPAILDASLWDALHLTPGEVFLLAVPGYDYGKLRFLAVARVAHIESVYDSAQFAGGGLLVDYTTYATIYSNVSMTVPNPPTFIWVRTANDAASVASVRQALMTANVQIDDLVDRRALTQKLITDPLQVDLSGELMLGAIATILLALVAVVAASWLNARSRLTSFAVLRALGTTPRQIAGVLIWEQGIVYGVGLGLGILLGVLLPAMLLPVLAFANVRTKTGALIGGADLPAIQMIAPVDPLALALGALVVICLGALVLMTLVVARPSMSATLRLNED